MRLVEIRDTVVIDANKVVSIQYDEKAKLTFINFESHRVKVFDSVCDFEGIVDLIENEGVPRDHALQRRVVELEQLIYDEGLKWHNHHDDYDKKEYWSSFMMQGQDHRGEEF